MTTIEKVSAEPASGPLEGVRVLDFCGFIAGSYGAMLLGDMGADVIKVEPLTGDPCRSWGPFIAGESRLFQGWNRNKRSIAVDLKADAGHRVVSELVAGADVVMVNFRPGVAEKLGIGYEELAALNPRLIYLSSTAFGAGGPYRDRPGYDPVLQTMSGAAKVHEGMCDTIHICSVAVSDYQAAMLGVSGVCAALYRREHSGEGQKIETSLLQAVMSVQSHAFVQPLDQDEDEAAGIYPYRMFETADDPVFLAVGTDRFWKLLCEALERDDLAADPAFETNPDRVRRASELGEQLQPILRTRGAREWEELLVAKGVPCAAARSCLEFFGDPQVEAMDMGPVIRHSTIGQMKVAGVPLHFGGTPGGIQRAAPRLGEHSAAILGELGYGDERVADLVGEGVVATTGA
jgi:crotonobetainyl-CoA:carnitine CoA-transferase CaiB-like acyl-CoA transferase